MLITLRKTVCFGAAFVALSALVAMPSKDTLGSRLYWLLNPMKYIDQNQTLKAKLEGCVSRLGFVDHVKIEPESGANRIEIVIQNVSTVPITGLIVQPLDDRLTQHGLDGRTLISFDPIPPDGRATYSEQVTGVLDTFPTTTNLDLVAWDVVNIEGIEVLEHIFWSHWPLVSSDEHLALATQEFCHDVEPSAIGQ